MAKALVTLAGVLSRLGQHDEAISRYREALEIYRAHPGSEDSVAKVLSGLGYVLSPREAEASDAAYREALAIRSRLHGPEDLSVLRIKVAEAYQLTQRRAFDKAIFMLREVIDAAERRLAQGDGTFGNILAGTRQQLAETLMTKGDLQAAEALYRSELARTADYFPPWVANLRTGLGSCLTLPGRFEEAESELTAAFNALRDAKGMGEVQWRRTATVRLAELYESWGKPEKSREWRAKLEAQPAAAAPSRR